MGKEVTKGSARNIGELGACEHVGGNIWLFGVWEVMTFIEIVVDKGDREEHKLGKVVTKKWRVAKSDEPGICIRFSCRDNSSFRLNTLGPLRFWQCFVYYHQYVLQLCVSMLLQVQKVGCVNPSEK